MKYRTIHGSKWGRLGLAVIAGEVSAALIWIAGAPEMSWLGFVAAGLAWSGNTIRCRRQRTAPGAA